ncbi:2'-5' RNA ligase family protein [Halobacteria archaeon AArc-m2/3/4]|uniref:2'-5' RNA ligase family protein n=1 Tax=Natronoglomus mannanivorans TaxID=2979990 RepID=A0AAP2Z2Z5_9EURY|nr:2'-5' RNA ligase family protein [Halobacteria archaeon AArc-xg1-1]MCU4972102.1 2'-5' RNA ligase family protein [Halobacteria archaeon AArc-m2/3/4]
MYSVNVPVPGRVRQIADDLFPELQGFQTVRDDHSCLLKRLGDADDDHVAQLQHRAHRALEGSPAVEARITGIDYFEAPPLGSAPVVYLAVESPGLEGIHADLVEVFGATDGLEGEDYVPHVTLARGGDLEDARRVADRAIEPVQWTVSELEFWDGTYKLPVSRVSLPA